MLQTSFPLELNAASAAEYTALKAQHPDTLVGFEAGGNRLFYGEDADVSQISTTVLLFTRETALGKFRSQVFQAYGQESQKELWSAGNDVYLAGLNKMGLAHQTKHRQRGLSAPIGSIINVSGWPEISD